MAAISTIARVFEILSSSSEEEEVELIVSKIIAQKSKILRKRTRINNYMDVVGNYLEFEFIRHFRVSQSLFDRLSSEFEASETYPSYTLGRNNIPADKATLFHI